MASNTELALGAGALLLAFLGFRGNIAKAKKAIETAAPPGRVFAVPGGNVSALFNSDIFTAPLFVSLRELYEKWGLRYGVDPDLLQAIARVESNENPGAVAATDASTGLMQILCRASCPNCPCQNNLNVEGWDQATPEKLFGPDFNISIGAQILAWNVDTYGLLKGVAVYNNWESRHDQRSGPFRNQGYVDKVMREFSGLRGFVDFT